MRKGAASGEIYITGQGPERTMEARIAVCEQRDSLHCNRRLRRVQTGSKKGNGVLGHEGPAGPAALVFGEGLESDANGGFLRGFAAGELGELDVVRLRNLCVSLRMRVDVGRPELALRLWSVSKSWALV